MENPINLVPLAVLLFVAMEAFFTGSEMAMVSSNKIRLNYLAKNGNKKASTILYLLNNPDKLFATTLVGVNLATVIATSLAAFYFDSIVRKDVLILFGFNIPKEIIVTIIIQPIILIFGEMTPNSVARKYPTITSLRYSTGIKIGYTILFPIIIVISWVSNFIGRLFKDKKSEFGTISRDELEILVAESGTSNNPKAKKIIRDIFDINELTARNIMLRLDEVVLIEKNETVHKLKELIKSRQYNRYPVYSDNIFNIIGTVHISSIIGADDKEPVAKYIEDLYIIPSSKPVVQILSELKKNDKHMGIVVNEFGAASGIITIDDILEEVIGEIKEKELESIQLLDENIFDASIYLDDFHDLTGIDFSDDIKDNVETLGGVINLILGRIAKSGEIVTYKDMKFKILEATDRQIKSIKLLDFPKK